MKSLFPRARLSALSAACLACLGASVYAQDASLKETVVTATRVEQPLTDVVADVTVLDREAIERSGAVGLADVLARLPGIEFARNGGPGATTSIFLRGAAANHTAVFIDGVRIDTQSGSGGATWEALPLVWIDRIEVLRGPAGAVYGSDAIAGVVQIFTRKGEGAFQPFACLGFGSHNTRKLDAGFSGGQGALDYSLGLARELSDGFNAKVASNPDRDGYANRSINARLGLQINASHRIETTLLDSQVDAQYDSNPTLDDHSLHSLKSMGLSWLANWNAYYSSRLSLSESVDRYETRPDPYLTETKVRSYLWHNELRQGGHLFTAALERREDVLDNLAITNGNADRSQDALALGYGYKHDAHTLQVNLRHDNDSEFGGKGTGSVAYAYGFATYWRATASAGTAFRAPTLYQRFSPYGDAKLKPENGQNFEFGLRYGLGSSSLSAVLYQNRISNLINFAGPGACASSFGCYENTARAQLKGMTLSGTHKLGQVNLHASLDLQNPRDLDTGKQLARRARQHGTLGVDTQIAQWMVGAEAQFSGMRYDYNWNQSKTYRLGGYSLLHVYASTRLAKDVTLLARIDNLTDRQYQLANGYYTPGRQLYVGLKWAPQ